MFNTVSGKIKVRVFALILLVLSCGNIVSAFRSIKREFSGLSIRKATTSGIISNHYRLYLLNTDKNPASQEFQALLKKILADDSYPLRPVGVSRMVYNGTSILTKVSKKAYTPFITVEDDKYFDKGVVWMIFGLSGIFLSFWMYSQTAKQNTPEANEQEELELPGLN